MTNIFDILLALLLGIAMMGTESQVVRPMPISAGVRAPVGSDQSAAVDNAMLDLLSYAADTPENRKWLTLGDMGAWYAATGISLVEGIEDLRNRPDAERERWMYSGSNHTIPPRALGAQYALSEDIKGLYGFDYFGALQFMEAGAPPDVLTAVTVQAGREEIASALLALGYVESPAEGGTLYSLREDYETDLRDASPLGRLGMLNRVVILNEAPGEGSGRMALLIARADAPIENALNAHAFPAQSLAGDPYYHAIAQALVAEDDIAGGELVGVIFLSEMPTIDPVMLLGNSDDAAERIAELEAWYSANPLSPWLVTALATYVDGEDVWLKAVVAFPPNADGATNAQSLERRLAEYREVLDLNAGNDIWTPASSGSAEIDGVPVAWATMQVNPELTNVAAWMQFLARERVPFLVPAEGD